MRKTNESYKIEGFVLKRINYKDADKIITIFTKQFGKVSCIAKGIRKIESKKKSHLEPLNKVEIFTIKTGDWYLITQAKAISTYSKIKSDINNLNYAIAMIEISNKILNESEPNIRFYNHFDKYIEAINENPSATLLASFIIKTLEIEGLYEREKSLEMTKYIFGVDQSKLKAELIKLEENVSLKDILVPAENDLQKVKQPDAKLEAGLLKALLLYMEYSTEIKLKTPII